MPFHPVSSLCSVDMLLDAAIESLLRRGTIPLLCGGATGCFGLYGVKVSQAAGQWQRVEAATTFDRKQVAAHATELQKHAGTCVALTVTSAATTYEATSDYRRYRTATQEEIGAFLISRAPFFMRPTVLITAAISLLATSTLVGGLRFMVPLRPALQQQLGVAQRS